MKRVIISAFLFLECFLTAFAPPMNAPAYAQSEPATGIEYGPFTEEDYKAIIATSTRHGRVIVSQKEGSISVEDALKKGIAEFVKNRGMIGDEDDRDAWRFGVKRAFLMPEDVLSMNTVRLIAEKSPSLYSFMLALAKVNLYKGYVNIVERNNRRLKELNDIIRDSGRKLEIK